MATNDKELHVCPALKVDMIAGVPLIRVDDPGIIARSPHHGSAGFQSRSCICPRSGSCSYEVEAVFSGHVRTDVS